MIDIKIDNFRITSDDRQYVLSELKTYGEESKKAGETFYKEFAYHTRIDTLINKLIELNIRRSNITSLAELKELFSETSERITNLINGGA